MSFKRFDTEDVVISAESITAPLWSDDNVTLQTFYTSSTQVGGPAGIYYYDIYQTGSSQTGARVQFSVAYANKEGSGSKPYNVAVPGKSPSATVYGQYRSLVLGTEDADFEFGGTTSNHFYALTVDRARYKEKLLTGVMTLELGINGSTETVKLTDNSKITGTVIYTDAGRVYDVVSGSAGTVYSGSGYTVSGSYGKFLPDVGIILLNAKVLDLPSENGGCNLGTSLGVSSDSVNMGKFYDHILSGSRMTLQSEETISSNFIFVRARNSEFNYSTNPSLLTGSGDLRHTTMIDSPQSYITSIGLYNDSNDLLAVAKLSKPLSKNFTKEALVRIKLDY